MQIKWWHYKTGIGALERERGMEESEYRRDERLVAASEVSLSFFSGLVVEC